MKATLASIACLLVAGFLAAASVDGNNKAVVIQKDVVKSGTGWQFICVPVNALNINGSTTGTIKLSTFLPPTTVTPGTSVWRNSNDAFESVATLNGSAWSADPELNPGETLWISDPRDDTETTPGASSRAEAGTGTPSKITFCGQERSLSGQGTSKKLTAMKNDGATAIKIKDFKTAFTQVTPAAGDEILVLKDGSSDYLHYLYGTKTEKWHYQAEDGSWPVVGDAQEIAPGEAFFYYDYSQSN